MATKTRAKPIPPEKPEKRRGQEDSREFMIRQVRQDILAEMRALFTTAAKVMSADLIRSFDLAQIVRAAAAEAAREAVERASFGGSSLEGIAAEEFRKAFAGLFRREVSEDD